MQNFEFYSPTKVVFGKDTHEKTGEIVKAHGFKKVFLHYGQASIKKNGIYDAIIKSLTDFGIEYCELGGVKPNPELALVKIGIEICIREDVDFVLAVGGGSVIDSAKLIALGAKNENIDPWDFSTKKKIPKKGLTHGVVLTIASAGSETSSSCVITNEELKLKRGFNSEFNRPLFAIMNPKLTFSVSKYQTACGVTDILMHTFERYFQTGEEAELTHSIAEAIMRNVIDAGKKVMENPKDYSARSTLMWAGSLSHNDLTGVGKNTGLTVHQLEHEISGTYPEVAHAAGLSVLFPAWAEYVYKSDIMKFARFAVNVWGCDFNFENPEATAFEGIKKCRDYFKDILKIPVTLEELGIGDEKFEEMAVKCTNYGTRKIIGITELDKEDIIEIFKMSL